MKLQSELAASQTELSTGNYADVGLTLGAQTGESVSLQAESAWLQTIADSNTAVATRLSTTQNALGGLQSGAQALLNSLIATNGSKTNASTIQTAGESDLRSLIAGLNTTLSGDYIFGGTNTS